MNKLEFREYNYHGVIYYCNCEGIILNKKFDKLTTFKGNDGYREVYLRGKEINKNGNIMRSKVKVHRIVAELFIPKPKRDEILEVNHKDCDRMNCNYMNLEWMTHLENVRYSVKCGNHYIDGFKGVNNPKAKLTESEVKLIRNELCKKYTNIELAKKFNVSVSTIYSIINMKTWINVI